MNMTELAEAFEDKQINKRIYWQLMREKFLGLFECQNLLQCCDDDISVEITKDGTILSFRGVRMFFDFSQQICRAEAILAMKGSPEQDDYNFLGKLLHKDDVLLDIGANVGVVSLSMLHDNPDIGKIYAFEPLPPTYERLQKNLALNGNPDKIETFNLGISDKSGSFDFYLPGADEAASMQLTQDEFYLRENIDGRYTGKQKIQKYVCQVSTLDDFVKDKSLERVDFIKIDVEGNEYNVLRGGRKSPKEVQTYNIYGNAA